MYQIGENLEEKLKGQLKYEHKSISPQRKMFDNLTTECIMNGIKMKVKNHHIQGILIHLHRSGEPIGDFWAKPIVRHGRMFLSFKKPIKQLIDASHVDVFDESIHNH